MLSLQNVRKSHQNELSSSTPVDSIVKINDLHDNDYMSQLSSLSCRPQAQMVSAATQVVPRTERWQRPRQQRQKQKEGWELNQNSPVSSLSLNLNRVPFRAGGISLCFDTWQKITSNFKILSIVKGLKLDFFRKPVQYKLPHEIQFSQKEANLVDIELQKLLSKGIITRSKIRPGDFVSNFFTRPKKDKNKVRCLLNLKQVNKFCRKNHFKMENLQTAINILRPGMKMATLDVVDSF